MKIMQFNVQDLFLNFAFSVDQSSFDQLNEVEWQLLGKTDVALKPLAKLRDIAEVIRSESPDIVCMNEVGGPESMHNFAIMFLNHEYESYLVRGNDERGIDCGFLVKKSPNIRCDFHSHKDYPVPFNYGFEEDPEGYSVTALMAQALKLVPPEERKFSRDVPELRLYRANEPKPFLVALGVHLKSGLDKDGIDKNGTFRRAAELRAALKMRNEIQTELGSDVPIIVIGDFNMDLRENSPNPDAQFLYQTSDLRDALAVARRKPYEQITQMSFFSGNIWASQIDYIFLPKALHSRVQRNETKVYRYVFPGSNEEVQFPASWMDRRQLPSDHYPVVCVLEL